MAGTLLTLVQAAWLLVAGEVDKLSLRLVWGCSVDVPPCLDRDLASSIFGDPVSPGVDESGPCCAMSNVDRGLLNARSIRVETEGGEIVCGALSSDTHRDNFGVSRATEWWWGSGWPALKPQGSETPSRDHDGVMKLWGNLGPAIYTISSVTISNDVGWQNSEIVTVQRHQI